eukprot:10638131-Alexandrium_andersonii.AAC.1
MSASLVGSEMCIRDRIVDVRELGEGCTFPDIDCPKDRGAQQAQCQRGTWGTPEASRPRERRRAAPSPD